MLQFFVSVGALTCLQVSTPAKSMHQHETPTYLWQYISADLFKMAGNEYLLVADQYSRSSFI